VPLIQGKSKKSFEKNVATEMEAGKPKEQSLAIAYNIQRKNRAKKMASGGEVKSSTESMDIKPMGSIAKAIMASKAKPEMPEDDSMMMEESYDHDDFLSDEMDDMPFEDEKEESVLERIMNRLHNR